MAIVRIGVCFVLAAFLSPASAQTFGEITGTVTDPTGAIVSGAAVKITNTSTNQTREAVTNDTGNYTVPFLTPGAYDVQVQSSAFKAVTRRGVDLQVGAVARINFALEVGEVTQHVEVSGGAPLLNTENIAVGTVIENRRIVELPLNGRNYLQLVALSPNVSIEAGASNQPGSFQGGERTRQSFAIAGQRIEFNRYTLDGVENTDVNFNTFVLKPSVDAVQEFTVQSGIYSAEFGRAISQINATTKSGTNSFHGAAFEFLRNSVLDAKSWKQIGDKNPFRRNQYGFTLGGPLVKNRLFFLSNFEATKDRKTTQQLANVPTERMIAGDFAGQSRIIFDPDTRVYSTDAQGNVRAVSALPFSNNAIPQARFHPISRSLLPLLAHPTVPGDSVLSNYVRQASRPISTEQFLQRIDFIESSRSSWFGRFSFGDEYEGDTAIFPTQEGRTETRPKQAVLANTRSLSPSIVNEFRFGLNLFANDRVGYYAFREDIGSKYGKDIRGLPISKDPLAWGIFSVAFTGAGLSSSIGSDNPFVTRDTTIQALDNVSMIRGAHTVKFGGEFRRDRYNEVGNQFTFTELRFAPTATFNPANRNATGFAVADFLLGWAEQGNRAFDLANVQLRSTSLAFYVEDSWKLTRKLTLNLGLRYEYTGPWVEKSDGMMGVQMFDPGVGPNGVLPPGQTKVPILTRPGTGDIYKGMSFHFADSVPTQVGNQYLGRSLVAPDRNGFAPRLGFAYSPTNRLTLRSGIGAFYVRDVANPIFDMGRNLAGRGAFNADPERPNAPFHDIWGSQREIYKCSNWSGPCLIANLFSTPSNSRDPYVIQYLFNIQRQLSDNISIEVGYQGSQGHKLKRQRSYNVAVPKTGPTDFRTREQRRPWPEIGALVYLYESGINSNYNALSMKLQQRFSHGLTYLVGYTWGKSIDNGGGARPPSGDRLSPKNVYNLRDERGLSQFDMRRRMVTSFLYELPVGEGKMFLNRGGIVDKFLGGWQIGTILTLADGTPADVASIGDTVDAGLSSNYPNATGISPFPANPTENLFWNINAFDATSPSLTYNYGNVGRFVLRRPRTDQWDFSLGKKIAIREGHALDFRFEAFNFSNHPNWIAPAANAAMPATFGKITAAKTMREMQIALKYLF